MQKVLILPQPKFWFSEFSAKVCDLRHIQFWNDWMIWNIIEEIRRYQADWDLFETSSIFAVIMQKIVSYRMKDDIFHKFASTSASILQQFKNISAINDCVIVTFCMSDYMGHLNCFKTSWLCTPYTWLKFPRSNYAKRIKS